MKLVDPLKILGLTEEQYVRVAAGSDEREGTQQMTVGEILTRSEKLAFIRGPLLVVEPAPRGVDLEECELHEMTCGHANYDRRAAKAPLARETLRPGWVRS